MDWGLGLLEGRYKKMKQDETPDLLSNETGTEGVIRRNFWKRSIKEIPQFLERLKINTKLNKWGKGKNLSK